MLEEANLFCNCRRSPFKRLQQARYGAFLVSLICTALSAFSSTASAAQVSAADSPVQGPDNAVVPRDPEVPEIVVTARSIEEDIQRVPLTVSFIDEAIMKQQNIRRASDLMYAVPSLTINPYFNTLTNSYAIRGLPAGVTTYFSDSPCCTGSASIPFTDIESIQVLNGPQGTLFGRSSAAGAVLITPVHPDLAAFGGFAEVTIGDYGRAQLAAALNFPLVRDRLAVRLSANITHVDGYTRAIGSRIRFDEQDNQTFRLGVELNVGRFENYTAVNFIQLDQTATNEVLTAIHTDAAGGLYNLPAAFAPAVFGTVCANAVALGLAADANSCIESRYNSLVGIKAALLAEFARVSAGGDAVRFEPTPVNNQPARLRLRNLGVVNVAQYQLVDESDLAIRLKDVFSYEQSADVASSPADGIGGLAEQGGASSLSGYGSTTRAAVSSFPGSARTPKPSITSCSSISILETGLSWDRRASSIAATPSRPPTLAPATSIKCSAASSTRTLVTIPRLAFRRARTGPKRRPTRRPRSIFPGGYRVWS